TGKSLHVGTTGRIAEAKYSLVDYNRAGIPLVEIVSEPDIRSAEEAQRYVQELRSILETLGVSDVRMEEGSMRVDANISLRERGAKEFGTKIEIKNLNSVRSVGRALAYEIERQTEALRTGEPLVQETRHFDEQTGKTHSMRTKEGSEDYRYFPEPDLVPIEPSTDWVERVRATLPELPRARRARLESEHGLTRAQVIFIGQSAAAVAYFDSLIGEGVEPRDAAVWMSQELARALNNAGEDVEHSRITPRALAGLIKAVKDGTVNLNSAKKVLLDAYEAARDPLDIVEEKGLRQVSDASAVRSVIDEVLSANAEHVERFRAGEEKVFGFLMGQVMRALGGQGSPAVVTQELRAALHG
ncbi:MAG: Asp-tRNA(Asn)/Glu-tRNA(Gln) amidotransferase subunit GatB, partial [Actinomycetota bacterium]